MPPRVFMLADRFYCMDPLERDLFAPSMGYVVEGTACFVRTGESYPIWRRLHRLYRPATGEHFYTASNNERYDAEHSYGYESELTSNQQRSTYERDYYPFYAAYVATSQQPGTVPLYRLWRAPPGDHLYTISAPERDAAVQTFGYKDEGVAGWVHPPDGIRPDGTAPLFRLLKTDPDPPFPDDPTTAANLAARNVAWSAMRDQRILPDNDAFHLEVEELTPPGTPGVGAEVEFFFGAGSAIRWWKEIRLFGSDNKPFGQDVVPQDAAGGGLAIEDAPGYTLLVGRYPISRLVGCSFVFSKAKQFGVHTGMYQLRLGDALWLRGKKLTFTWIRD
jgi:hypothetical protein